MKYQSSRTDSPPLPKDASTQAVGGEKRLALDKIYSAAFEELKRLATSTRRSVVSPAVSTGTLINAAWMRLANSRKFTPESKEHFMNVAAKVMRHVLIEVARRNRSLKRGGQRVSSMVTLDPDTLPIVQDRDILRLDLALNHLEKLSPRQAKIVEEKFFGGFEENEIAVRLGISPSTVSRDWRAAKAWLAVEMRR